MIPAGWVLWINCQYFKTQWIADGEAGVASSWLWRGKVSLKSELIRENCHPFLDCDWTLIIKPQLSSQKHSLIEASWKIYILKSFKIGLKSSLVHYPEWDYPTCTKYDASHSSSADSLKIDILKPDLKFHCHPPLKESTTGRANKPNTHPPTTAPPRVVKNGGRTEDT